MDDCIAASRDTTANLEDATNAVSSLQITDGADSRRIGQIEAGE